MDCCYLCTGFHPTSECEIGYRHIRRCLITGTADEPPRSTPDLSNVVEIFTADTHRSGDLTRRRQPWRAS